MSKDHPEGTLTSHLATRPKQKTEGDIKPGVPKDGETDAPSEKEQGDRDVT